uniref:Uncharacterized protein n=1 Tax=Rhodnius prolixus TaxID=13249 RepID=T1HG26_RHOPR
MKMKIIVVFFLSDEYTKITTPRQDMLFKKGYLGKKKTIPITPPQDSVETQSAALKKLITVFRISKVYSVALPQNEWCKYDEPVRHFALKLSLKLHKLLFKLADSLESDQYMCEEQVHPQYLYPGTGYMDHTGVYYINNSYEVYDPYTGNVTVIVGPGYPTGPHTGVLTAVPCQPVPLQPLEWFNPSIPQPHPAYSVPMYSTKKKRNSIDSQNCSGQSSETTCPPGSPQEPVEGCEPPVYPPQYVYPGYMFGAPLYNMNGVTVQGVVPQSAPLPPPADQAKRRKKRRRRRRGGVTDEGSESSCEDILSCDASGAAESQSGASSDTAPGSSSSKTNSDSGIHTDPTALTSGANSPRLPIDEPYFHNDSNENEDEVSTSYLQEQQQQPNLGSEEDVVEKEVEKEVVEERSQSTTLELEHTEEPVISADSSLRIIEEKSVSIDAINIDEEHFEPSINTNSISIMNELCNESENNEKVNQNYQEEVLEEKLEVSENTVEEEVLEKEDGVNEIVVEQDANNEMTASLSKEAIDVDEITSRLAEQTVQEEVCERPITEAVTKWLRSQGSSVVKLSNSSSTSSEESDDEGIEEGEDALVPADSTTGQKNGQGNPFPASSPSSDNGTRVAIHDYIPVEEQDWAVRVGQMCDAKRSVHKYYSLGAVIDGDSPTPPAVVLKTAMHLGQSGPFPCGICCILQ